ncbi:type VII secretion-associated serine protease mycosin [Streptomyces sp. TLI_053]|uniref:type VII secretion-associated serine protease mycosin n=1 Tax=Streptomyces sp. TLI_053 TaxID=1855352 RepID=UPI00087A0779|nr:type VII secretion-associated serine protease mycosin [Streptomyces sp. TLI_053]SDT66070.1 type VII secretion-associated serine protease mycosin [Streptomyces sp. TLI_053]
MRRMNVGVRGFAAAMAAAGIVAGPTVGPAAAVDSIRDQQWHLDTMKAPEIWQASKGQGVTVAVVDGGFRLDHPDLVGQLLPGKDLSGLPGGIGVDKSGHGTGIAGLIAGSGKGLGGKGAYGLAPDAKVLPIKININDDPAQPIDASGYLKQVSQGITYAADQGAKVINVSSVAGSSGVSAGDVAELEKSVKYANGKGALVVAGAGNSGQEGNPALYPAALPSIVAVAAADRAGTATDESEHGPQIDIAAPGVDIYTSCVAESGYCKKHGTSDATALVSASAALLWAVHPDWAPNQIIRVLIGTAGKPKDGSSRTDFIGYGIVRPRVALQTPGDPGSADVSPLVEPSASATSVEPSTPTAASQSPEAQPAPTPPPPASAAPAAEPKDDGSSPALVAAVVGGLLLVAGAAVVVVRRRGGRSAR